MSEQAPAPEFTRPIRVTSLPAEGLRFREAATPEECAALAARWQVLTVKRFAVEGRIERDGEGWRLRAKALTRVTQPCAVTLEPVDQIIEEPFAILYLPDAADPDEMLDLDIEAEDPPEPLGRNIDPGEAAVQIAALAIDPYPRAAGAGAENADRAPWAAAPEGQTPLTDEDARPKPFAGLAALKAKLEGDGNEG